MAVITISRQYGSGGNEIAARVCETLGYRYFDKGLMAQVASEVGLAEDEIVDFSEANYKVQSFLDRLFDLRRVIAAFETKKEYTTGERILGVEELGEDRCITLVQSTIHAAYKRGNVVIVGRAGQAILQEMPGVFHVRIEAPLSTRIQRIQDQENVSLEVAQKRVNERDKASADYLKRFYDIDWSDPMLYHLVINTGKWDTEVAAHLIVNAVSCLPPAQSPG